MAQYPSFNDREFDLIKKITENTAEMADIEAGDVHTIVAGAGISVSGATGDVTITNTGVLSITGTANQITASSATGAVTLSFPADAYFATSLLVGLGAAGTAVSGVGFECTSTSTSSPRGIMTSQHNTGTDGARFHMRKSRGTRAVPTTVVTGDNLGRIVGTGYDGANYLEMASIYFATEGTIAATRVPTNIQFWTATNATPSVLTLAAIINSSQQALFSDGTAALPSIGFGSTLTTGFYSAAATTLGFASGGVASATFTRDVAGGGLDITAQGTNTNLRMASAGTGTTSLVANGSSITVAGTTNGSITLTPSGTGQILIPSGANATPTLNNAAWGHANTGLAFGGSDAGAETVQWVYRGTASWAFGATAQTFYHPGAGVITADTSLSLRTNPAGANTHIFLPNSTNNVLLGGLTTDGTGVLQFPAAITSAGGITFGTDVNLFRDAANSLTLSTAKLNISYNNGPIIQITRTGSNADARVQATAASGEIAEFGVQGSAGTPASVAYFGSQTNHPLVLRTNNTTFLSGDTSQNLTITKLVTSYNGIATAGNGVVTVQAAARATAQTGANASVATYTVGAADASFVVSANVNVTTATAHNFTVTVTYTDEGNTSRTLTLSFSQLAGTIINNITNVTGAGPYEGLGAHIRCKASTSITIATTGTFTTVTYNVEGNIRKLS